MYNKKKQQKESEIIPNTATTIDVLITAVITYVIRLHHIVCMQHPCMF